MEIATETLTKNRGMCSACKYEAGCIYPHSKDQIVLNCGQFELGPPVERPPATQEQVELEKLWKKTSRKEPQSRLQGLCGSCEDRDVCIYPKPEGGVWRCEEYR